MNKKTYVCVQIFLCVIGNRFAKKQNLSKSLFSIFLYFITTFSVESQQVQTLQSLDEVFVTSSRFELSKNEVGKPIIKITAKEIEQNLGKTLVQLLNAQVGLTINGSYGQAGNNLSTNIRGGRNRQVLVIVDGVPINDPSQIENNFDLNLIGLEQIESIEILKGPSSVLYGANASTAVINIVTKKALNQGINTTISSIVGTNNTAKHHRHEVHDVQNSVTVMGSHNKLSFNTNFSHRLTDGISALSPMEQSTGFEKDNYEKINLYLKLGYAFSKQFSVSTYYNFDRYDSDYDESFGFTDANYNSNNRQNRIGVSSKYNYQNGSLNLNTALNKNKRSYDSSYPTKFEAESWNIDFFNKYIFASKLYSIIGVKYSNSEMDSYNIPFGSSNFQINIDADSANDSNFDSYFNLIYTSENGFNFNTGVRLNYHSTYDFHLVYSINPSYVFELSDLFLKFSASYSTAFISPSLYQLFAPNYGNTLLNPQEDATLEFGFELSNPTVFEFQTTIFKRTQNDFIDYVVTNPATFSGNYQNISGDTSVQGLEAEFKYIGFKKISFDLNYAFIESKSNELYRIPKHKININALFDITNKVNLSIGFQYNSQRVSPFIENSDPITLSAYSLLNIGVSRSFFNNQFKVFANVSNLFDEIYEEAYRYSTLGRNYRIGVKFSF